MKSTIPERSRSFFDPAPPRCAAGKKLALRAQTVFPAAASLRGQGPRKNIDSCFRDVLFPERCGFKKKIAQGKIAVTVAGLALLLVLAAGRSALAATELHGADSSFRAQGITILWAILKGPTEASTQVYIRILHDKGAAPSLAFFGVEAVDPFSKERAWMIKAPLWENQTLQILRTDFQEKTDRWFHFYADQEALEKHQPVLTIFYHGVPDTAPELLSEVDIEAYLLAAPLRIK